MKILSKDQMKKIMGGAGDAEGLPGEAGTRCVFYCCPDGGGDCGPGTSSLQACTSNEYCQQVGQDYYSCSSGSYLAALCKG